MTRWLEAVALLGAAAIGWWFYLHLSERLPTPTDHTAVAAVLSKEARPGDVLLLFPWWTERARLDAPPGLPVVGYLGSDGDDLELHPQIWVLSQPGLARSDARSFQASFAPGRASNLPARQLGTMHLERFRNDRYRPPLISSDDEPAQAAVSLPGTAPLPCTGSGGRLTCTAGAEVRGPEWHEVHYRPSKCLWIHPPAAPAAMTLTLPDDSAANRVRVRAGLLWEHAAKTGPALTPVEISLEGTASAALATIAPGDEQLHDLERSLPEGGSKGLRISIRTANPESRELCLSWTLYGPPPPAGRTPGIAP